MNHVISRIKNLLLRFFDTRAAGLYFILFAAAIAIATFIENDFGTSAAQKVIFKAWWFELLLLLFGVTIIVNIFRFRMFQQRKWPLLLFHGAIIIILTGAGLTRYFGFEGVMHIRENESASSFLSSELFLKFKAEKAGETFEFKEPVLFASLGNNRFKESYVLGGDLVEVEVLEFIPNPKQEMIADATGTPSIKIVLSGMNGREEYVITEGQTNRFGNLLFNFTERPIEGAINLAFREQQMVILANRPLTQMVMATQQLDTIHPDGTYHPLALRSLYSDGTNNFVFSEFIEKANYVIQSEDPKVKNESTLALKMQVSVNGIPQTTYVYGNKGLEGKVSQVRFDNLNLGISYGSHEVTVPFAIRLNDFIMDRYPGTNSASSYASEVTLLDPRDNTQLDYRIYMNNILDYEGYRFFQSSYDRDEKGTYLSVNSDFWGTIISYLGYALLTLGMIWTLFSKNTRFYDLIHKIKKLRQQSGTFVFLTFLLLSSTAWSQSNIVPRAVSQEHADRFSKIIVQDFKGRMKPMHTLSRELMRKVTRKESWEGLSADQVLLSMFVNKKEWYGVPLVKLGKHKDIQTLMGVSSDYASYKDFFTVEGKYKLQEEVRRVYALDPIDRGVYARELMKIDERLNILSMMFSGSVLKIVPVPNDPNNTWVAYSGHTHGPEDHPEQSSIADNFFNSYGTELQKASSTGNYSHAGHLLDELVAFQKAQGAAVIPSDAKINSEILLNKLNIFNKLAAFYVLLGLALLFFLFISVFQPHWNLKRVYILLFGLVLLGFALHTLGLGLRWYVSGRAPWSNGYESMIYIAWTTTLAGVLFTRKSFGGLAATMVLAATLLFVSTLSFLDPEITPLVPVLKSYWLTIHVSLEAGSYGFLMLGAIIGIINLILMIFLTQNNQIRVKRIVKELSYISELTLIGGLFMVSIGTYLGGVWANESWGRYWGWDAKETWALVTILVYAFILHMRFIPKLRGLYAYNVATIFGLASVIMTYYGVNYYLSGLHSYATGDPVPVPTWVYIVVSGLMLISVLAYFRKRKFDSMS